MHAEKSLCRSQITVKEFLSFSSGKVVKYPLWKSLDIYEVML